MDDLDSQNDFDINDSDSNSSSSIIDTELPTYENTQPLILELHEIKKDVPAPLSDAPPRTESNPAAPTEGTKLKKIKKKKRAPANHPTTESLSTSDTASSQQLSKSDATEEEFFDAQASLHVLPENQAVNITSVAPSPVNQNPPIAMRASNTITPTAAPTPLPMPISQSASNVPIAPNSQPAATPQVDLKLKGTSHPSLAQAPSPDVKATTKTNEPANQPKRPD